jgi:hypothetical protein
MTKPDPKRFLEVARAAAIENAGAKAVSSFIELIDEGDGAFSFIFESKLEGYQGWHWSVTLFDGGDEAPTLSEVVLLPGEKALLAPAWVPWSERLADWKALQAELEAQAALEAEEATENSEDDDEPVDHEDDEEVEELELEEIGEVESAEPAELEAQDSAIADLATTDLEPGEDSEDDSEDAGGKPPLFARWGRRRNKNKKR